LAAAGTKSTRTAEAQTPQARPVNCIKGKMYLPDGLDASDIIWYDLPRQRSAGAQQRQSEATTAEHPKQQRRAYNSPERQRSLTL